jgi:hypothetical protein
MDRRLKRETRKRNRALTRIGDQGDRSIAILAPSSACRLSSAAYDGRNEMTVPFRAARVCPGAPFHGGVCDPCEHRARSTNRCTLNDTIPSRDKGWCALSWEGAPNNGASSCRVARSIQTQSDKAALHPPKRKLDVSHRRRHVRAGASDALPASKFRALASRRRICGRFPHPRRAGE